MGSDAAHVVWEVVWFNSLPTASGCGHGSALFARIHRLAQDEGVLAVLVDSTTQALSYWITRPNLHIASVLLRRDQCSILQTSANLMNDYAAEAVNVVRHKAIIGELVLKPGSVFSVGCVPPDQLACLYDDIQLEDGTYDRSRNKSGKFRGLPYRYGIMDTTHVIYPTSPRLVADLEVADLLVHHTKKELSHLRPLAAAAQDRKAEHATHMIYERRETFGYPSKDIIISALVKSGWHGGKATGLLEKFFNSGKEWAYWES